MLNCDDAKTFRAGNSVRGICSVTPWGATMRHIILSETNLLIQKFCTVVTDFGSLMCNLKVCA